MAVLAISLVALTTSCGYEQYITINTDGTSDVTAKIMLKEEEIQEVDETFKKEYNSSFNEVMAESGFIYSGERVLDGKKYKVYNQTEKQNIEETNKMFVLKNDEQAVVDMNSDSFDFTLMRSGQNKDVEQYEHLVYRFEYPNKIVNASIVAEDNTMTISTMDMLDKDLDRVYVTFKEGVTSRKDLKVDGVKDGGYYNKTKGLTVTSTGVIEKFRVNNKPQPKNSYKASKDGKYKVEIKLASGVEKKFSFTIDKTKPTTNIKAKTYTKDVKITYKDSLSGIKKATLNNKSIKSGTKVTKDGKYTLKITDRAGNTKIVKFNRKKL